MCVHGIENTCKCKQQARENFLLSVTTHTAHSTQLSLHYITTCSNNQAVLVPSDTLPETPTIRGWDFNNGRDLDGMMDSFYRTGFQGTTFGQAIHEVNRMVRRLETQKRRETCAEHLCLHVTNVSVWT